MLHYKINPANIQQLDFKWSFCRVLAAPHSSHVVPAAAPSSPTSPLRWRNSSRRQPSGKNSCSSRTHRLTRYAHTSVRIPKQSSCQNVMSHFRRSGIIWVRSLRMITIGRRVVDVRRGVPAERAPPRRPQATTMQSWTTCHQFKYVNLTVKKLGLVVKLNVYICLHVQLSPKDIINIRESWSSVETRLVQVGIRAFVVLIECQPNIKRTFR